MIAAFTPRGAGPWIWAAVGFEPSPVQLISISRTSPTVIPTTAVPVAVEAFGGTSCNPSKATGVTHVGVGLGVGATEGVGVGVAGGVGVGVAGGVGVGVGVAGGVGVGVGVTGVGVGVTGVGDGLAPAGQPTKFSCVSSIVVVV